MFEQSILPEARTHQAWTVALAFFTQVVAVGVLIAIPLLYLQPLPVAELSTMLVAPSPPPPPPPPAAPQMARVVPKRFDASHLYAPRVIPKTIATIHDIPPAPADTGVAGGVPGGVPGGQIGGVLGGILGSIPSAAPPPPPVKRAEASQPKPAAPETISVGGRVQAARLISAPNPVYPSIAKTIRIQGVVVMDAVIGTDGHIEHLKAVSGNPLLIGAAMDAVKNWIYRPTYLNGRPARVNTEIDVHFTLST